ncbi:hypothetical protein BGZ73_000383 [Actinomortierella ambigua]|nr:hypothetical protein BGZ73_000383 [Actinomortierella ambigua]
MAQDKFCKVDRFSHWGTSLVVRNTIGAGGYGQVYHASWNGRTAAVKKFFVVQDDIRQSAAIQHEIDMLEKLRYRHIIQFYGTTYHEGMLVLVMDYAEGGSLKSAIDGRRITDWATKKRVAQEIVRGLAYIHHEKVLHRDLKSMNVLFTRHMEVKLCDFGLATLKVRSASSTTTLKGTIRWMAPELFALRPKYSTKSDMYALGMVMWEMAANCTMPFQHQSNNEMVIRFVAAGEREELPKETPDDYRQWVERCWDHDPLKRPEARDMVVEDDVPDHTSEARALLAHANKDDVEALLELASIYENGTGVVQDDSAAFKWYHRAAELQSALAQAMTGDNFYHGRGTLKDLVAAAYWRRRAAEKGYSEAQLTLGEMYMNGRGVAQDYTEALSWFRKSAEQGKSRAQYNLGLIYMNGQGIAQDYAQAAMWYRKSAEQGNADAQCNLGWMYENGQGISHDYSEAVSWYRKAAEQGNAVAQYNLGVMYKNGRGIARDYAQATMWYHKSAEQGDADAQYALGQMYMKGRGVGKNIQQATQWYRKAADQGHARAQ